MATLPVLVGGEALFDFISNTPDAGLAGTRTFEKRAGGSPFNIAVGVRRLDVPVNFVGKIGVDQFGEALIDFLEREKISVDEVVRKPGTKTTLAFVAVDRDGKVDFRFYRDNAADIALTAEEIGHVDPAKYSLLHCGGIVLAHPPTAEAYLSLVKKFADAGKPISVDPTIRLSLIDDAPGYRDRLLRLIRQVAVLKVSDEELLFLGQREDADAAVQNLPLAPEAIVVVTLGSKGARIYREKQPVAVVPGFSVKVAETTGCGDSFMAATLSRLAGRSTREIFQMPVSELEALARFANAAAAIVATRYGAAEANPTPSEVEEMLTAGTVSQPKIRI